MKFSETLRGIGNPVAYYPGLAKIVGGVTSALFLCQINYWGDKGHDGDGWIYKTQEELTEETGLTRREQEGARKSLRGLGILEERNARLEHRLYYRINDDALDALWEAAFANAPNRHSGTRKTAIPEVAKPPPVSLPETTSENTTESAHERQNKSFANGPGARVVTAAFELLEIEDVVKEHPDWPTWYAVAYTVPGWTMELAKADAWRTMAKITPDLAERVAYALRDWWPTSSDKRQKKGDPYKTWQNWCRRDRDVPRGGNNARNGIARGNPPEDSQDESRQDRAQRMANERGRAVDGVEPNNL